MKPPARPRPIPKALKAAMESTENNIRALEMSIQIKWERLGVEQLIRRGLLREIRRQQR